MGNRVVTITVGIKPDHENFTVHERLIRDSSTLIEAYLEFDEREHPELTAVLTDYQSKDFLIYNQWLYTERLFMKAEGDGRSISEGRSLIKGYLLGHYLGDMKYRDTLMDALIKWGDGAETEDRMKLVCEQAIAVFDGTEAKDPLRRFITDFTVWNTEYELWSKNYKRFPQDFVAMVSHGYAYRCHILGSGPSKRVILQACLYHCHGDNPCYKAKPERQDYSVFLFVRRLTGTLTGRPARLDRTPHNPRNAARQTLLPTMNLPTRNQRAPRLPSLTTRPKTLDTR